MVMPRFDQEFDEVMETLEGARDDKMKGEDPTFVEGWRKALVFACELVDRRLGRFTDKNGSLT